MSQYDQTPRQQIHYLGTLAFIGLVLYLCFLPVPEFDDYVTLSPYDARVKAESFLAENVDSASEYRFKSIEVVNFIGLSQQSYLHRFCNADAIESIKALGIPLKLYKLKFSRNSESVILCLNPSSSSLYTIQYSPPISVTKASKALPEAIRESESKREQGVSFTKNDSAGAPKAVDTTGTDSIAPNPDSAIEKTGIAIEHDSANTDKSRIIFNKTNETPLSKRPSSNAYDLSLASKSPLSRDDAVLSVRRELVRLGIIMDSFRLIEVKTASSGFDYRITWESAEICNGAVVTVATDVTGRMIHNIHSELLLPEYWFIKSSNVWSSFRWIALGLGIVGAAFLVLLRFSRAYFEGGLWSPRLAKVIILVFAFETVFAVNELPTESSLWMSALKFLSRFLFIGITGLIAWRTLTAEVGMMPLAKTARKIYFRDGIIMGLFAQTALLGIDSLLLWIGHRTGLMPGLSFMLGEKSFATIPSYSGFFPAIETLLGAVEFIAVAFPLIFSLIAILERRIRSDALLKLTLLALVMLVTLIEAATFTCFIVLLCGNLILGVFAYYFIHNFLRYNLAAYITAISTYYLVSDGYHYLRGGMSPFFVLNGIFLFAVALIPIFIFLHLCFFSELRGMQGSVSSRT